MKYFLNSNKKRLSIKKQTMKCFFKNFKRLKIHQIKKNKKVNKPYTKINNIL